LQWLLYFSSKEKGQDRGEERETENTGFRNKVNIKIQTHLPPCSPPGMMCIPINSSLEGLSERWDLRVCFFRLNSIALLLSCRLGEPPFKMPLCLSQFGSCLTVSSCSTLSRTFAKSKLSGSEYVSE